MKSRAPLALMEQTVMVLVFALAAALCLRAFVLADGISRRVEATDRAVLWAESAADTLTARNGDLAQAAAELGGNLDGQRWIIPLDETWQETAGESAYTLTVQPVESDQPLLGKAQIDVAEKNGESLFSLEVCWQEALTQAQADRRLARNSWSAVTGYYQADCQAQEILSQLRAGERPQGVTEEGENVFSYACPISDAQTLEVRVRLAGERYEILAWRAVFTADWQADEDLDLWDGST